MYYRTKLQFGGYDRLSGSGKRQAKVLGPLECAIANKLIWSSAGLVNTDTTHKKMGGNVTPPNNKGKDTAFKLSGKLLHGGKGKDKLLVDVNCHNNPMGDPDVRPCTSGGWEGLNPPTLEESGGVVHGDDKMQMQKENKHRWRWLKNNQTKESQWTMHQVTDTHTPAPHPQNRIEYRNSMCPTGRALAYLAAGLLTNWATLGCPTQMGQPWTKEEIWAAVARSPHRSALSPEAIDHFATEAAKKVCTKQARIVAWDDIKDNSLCQLKISLIATIPHKSKAYRSILNLSFCLCLNNGGVQALVNDTMEKTAPKGVIDQIGEYSCLCRDGPNSQSVHGQIGH